MMFDQAIEVLRRRWRQARVEVEMSAADAFRAEAQAKQCHGAVENLQKEIASIEVAIATLGGQVTPP